jgi:hypothetical protein
VREKVMSSDVCAFSDAAAMKKKVTAASTRFIRSGRMCNRLSKIPGRRCECDRRPGIKENFF